MAIQSETVLASTNGIVSNDISPNGIGSRHPGNTNSAKTVTDLELQELLEKLTVAINTASSALDAAAATPAREIKRLPPRPEPQPQPRPGLEMDDPIPLSARFAPQSQPSPKQHQGISRNITAAIISLVMAAGIGWLLHIAP